VAAGPQRPIPWSEGEVRHAPLVLPDGRVRRLVTLSPDLEARYEAAILPWIPALERRLGPTVYANRSAARGGLLPAGPAWRRWRRAVTGEVGRGGFVVRGDVADCYASIPPAAAASALASVGADPAALVEVLGTVARGGVRGLPIGPWPSAVIANVVLADADRAVAATGARIHRWVDDIVLVCCERRRAAIALDAWADALRPLGLSPNPGKTGITPAEPLGPDPSEPAIVRAMLRAP
jgi:Reverse transcriptase (RNA-dependent DNA polymerase)